MSLFTGPGQTGEETPVPIEITGECVNLTQPAKSGLNIAPVNLELYFNADCVKGRPGGIGDIYYVLGSLGAATFPYDAVS